MGTAVALLTALAWAGSSILIKKLTVSIDTLSLNTLRLWAGSILLIAFVLLSGRVGPLLLTPPASLACVMASGVIAMAVGDTLYIRSLSLLDVSRAFPIAQCSFPVLTALVAVLALGESLSWGSAAGAILVLAGIYLIAVAGRRPGPQTRPEAGSAKGVALALVAALTWTVGAAALKLGVTGMDTFVAASIRIPTAAAIVSLLAFRARRSGALRFRAYGAGGIALAFGAGVLTYGLAAVGYVTSMQMIGAAKTVILTATAPLMVLPFSVLVLRERPTPQALAGMLFCVGGVLLVAV